MDAVTLHHGDALDVLRGLADDSVDAVVTDPPYGLSDHDAGDVAEALACWLSGEEYVHGRGGFMGRSWDAFVPGPVLWREVYRVLKPGGHLLCFAGTRTQDLMGIAIRLAGFECRDTLQWLYGSGFPKSHDVSKAIDRNVGEPRPKAGAGRIVDRNALDYGGATGKAKNGLTTEYTEYPPNTDAARQWDGWGTALKPAHEPILVFRKPLAGTVAANVQQWGTGGLNIEACRVGTETTQTNGWRTGGEQVYGGGKGITSPDFRGNVNAGRWPPNVVLSHSEQCRRVGTRRVRGGNGVRGSDAGNTMYGGGKGMNRPTTGQTVGYADADGLETVDDWRCVDGCAVRALAEQSGERPSGAVTRSETATAAAGAHGIYGTFAGKPDGAHFPASTGTAARFFPNFEASPLDTLDAPWLYTAKASRRERTCNGTVENTHSTVKPISLCRWLTRLITPPGGIILDPFCGSGSIGIAAIFEGFGFIGIERETEYCEIARARLEWAELERGRESFRLHDKQGRPACDTKGKATADYQGGLPGLGPETS